MSIVSQKVDARNEIAWSGFVWSANKGIVRDATGWVLAPIGITPEAFTTDIADVQGQFPIVYNTDRMPYIPAVHNTAYYYDSSVAGGAITTTVTTTPIGKGVVSEEGNYILLDLVPTINKSVLWDQPWSVPTVINVNTPIEENPDRTVQKIETDWSKILIPFDPFYVDWSDQVFAKPTDVFIPSNATTDEFMMIDTATGQVKTTPWWLKNITVNWATALFTETGTQTDHNTNFITTTFTKQTKGIIIVTGTLTALNSTIPNPFTFLLWEWIVLNWSNVAYNQTNYKLEHAYFWLSTEKQIINQYSFDLPAWTHTFGLWYHFVLGLGTVWWEQTSIWEVTYTILYI